jgi:hypothetical protein
MHSERKIEEISRGVISGSAERKGLTESEKHSIELKEVQENWEQALRGIKEERIRHAWELAEIREETRKKERDAAESERKRCNILERKIAKVEETVAARETTAWLEEVSSSVQKDTVKEGSKPVVTLQPSVEGKQNIYEIENLMKEAEGAEDAPNSASMVMSHRWTAGAMLILLGMVYLCSNHVLESVDNTHVKGVLKCWEDAPMQVSGRLPISWKITESVGTMTWCTWKGLRDPGYQM